METRVGVVFRFGQGRVVEKLLVFIQKKYFLIKRKLTPHEKKSVKLKHYMLHNLEFSSLVVIAPTTPLNIISKFIIPGGKGFNFLRLVPNDFRINKIKIGSFTETPQICFSVRKKNFMCYTFCWDRFTATL